MLRKAFFRALLLSMVIVYQTSLAQNIPHYEAIQRLHLDILKDYNGQVIPLVERTKSLVVTTALTLTTLEFDEQHSRFAAKGFYSMKWKDPRLTWDPLAYDGVASIHLPSEAIWKPDLEVYNVQGKLGKERIFASTVALVMSDGSMIYVPLNSFDAICTPDATRYPNDEVTCKVVVGSWTHSMEKIKILTDKNATEINIEVPNNQTQGWELVSNRIVSKETIYDCCPDETYQSLEYSFVIQRRAPSAVFAITIPAILVSLLTLGSMLMPVQASSRLIVGMINLLITCTYLLYFHTHLAAVGSSAPLVVQYFGALGILVSISVLQAALGIRFVSSQSEPSSRGLLKRLFLTQNVQLLGRKANKDNAGNEISKSEDENGFNRGEETWLTVFLAIDRWIFILYTIIFAALIKAYLL